MKRGENGVSWPATAACEHLPQWQATREIFLLILSGGKTC